MLCVEVEDGYCDAYTIEGGNLEHVNGELSPPVVRSLAEWVLGDK